MKSITWMSKWCFGFLILILSYPTAAQDATEILKRSDDVVYSPKDQHSVNKIIVIDKNGNEKEMIAEFLQKGRDKRLVRFTSPASQAGIAFLSLPEDVMYLYLPAYKKERRIASHIKNQGFAGTDFSYDDMEAKPLGDKFNPELLSQTSEAYVLELTPKPEHITVYSKIIITISKLSYYGTYVEYFDKAGTKVKELINKDVQKIDGYWIAKNMLMTDLKQDHKTRMIIQSVSFDKGISDEEFTIRKLVQ